MELNFARGVAEKLIGVLKPSCERIEIAGSIRRGKPEVKDIEIVCIPRSRDKRPQFGKSLAMLDPLEAALDDLVRQEKLTHLTGADRMKKFFVGPSADGVKVDLFIVRPPASWGVIFTLRTGPAEYSRWLVTQRRSGGACPNHLRVKDGEVRSGREVIIPTPEEQDFFNVLELDWVEPEQRQMIRTR